MKQLTAIHPATGMKIVQRWLNNERYLKVTPSPLMKLVVDNIKRQFQDSPISIIEGNKGWVKIVKQARDPKLEEAAKKGLEKQGINVKDIDEEFVIKKEAEMLKNQGFQVKIEEILE